jgi:DNA-binding NarL/FixJ family response regulator
MKSSHEAENPGREPAKPPVRVLLVDDHQLVRAGLRSLLSVEEDILVVGEAESGRAALDLCAQIHPDLVVVDAMLPKQATPWLIRTVRTRFPAIQVLALAECARGQCSRVRHAGDVPVPHCYLPQNGKMPLEDCLEMALMAGACGAIRKTCSPEELVRAIRHVAPGRYWTELETARWLMEHLQPTSRTPSADGYAEGLTRREVQVIRELILGHSNKTISRSMGITEQSAKNLISRVLAKLGLESRVQLAVYAVNTRLLERYASLLDQAR